MRNNKIILVIAAASIALAGCSSTETSAETTLETPVTVRELAERYIPLMDECPEGYYGCLNDYMGTVYRLARNTLPKSAETSAIVTKAGTALRTYETMISSCDIDGDNIVLCGHWEGVVGANQQKAIQELRDHL